MNPDPGDFGIGLYGHHNRAFSFPQVFGGIKEDF